jgi:uncharacterized protein YyaL (SSP411 family)
VGEAGVEFHFSPRPNRAADINWRSWSAASFDEAQKTGKPILLSISAVWCHWCHVMDETTYSHPAVIELINQEYVPIRVDNDLRPDINQRYNMGGWPTTAFLTATGDILTGATYMPPDQMADALSKVASYHRTHQAEIAVGILESRKKSGSQVARSSGDIDPRSIDTVLDAITAAYDPEHGGFGTEPKFPQTDAILLLLEQGRLRPDPELSRMAAHTLDRMASGGTYDRVEGGFFRYSTTRDWSVPHFEKMLEDHAGLVAALALAGHVDVLDKTTGYLDRVLKDPKTGLYAGSQDADEDYYSKDAQQRAGLAAPYVDRRAYTGWNAALATAYLEASLRLDRPALRERAAALLEALFRDAYRPGAGMTHALRAGEQLGDQVWSLRAAVMAYQAGLGARWLSIAADLAAHLEARYADQRLGGYFDRADSDALGRLVDPIKPLVENSIAAMALFELDVLTGDPDAPHRARAQKALASVAALPRQYGLMAAVFARALDRMPHAIKVTTANRELARAAVLAHPYAVIDPAGDDRAVLCFGTICLAPMSTPQAVVETLRDSSKTRA